MTTYYILGTVLGTGIHKWVKHTKTPPQPISHRAGILVEEDRLQLAIPTDGISVKRTEQGSGPL